MVYSPLQRRQLVAFIIVWLSYASTYLLRKPLGVIKADLTAELWFDNTMLGWLDTAFLLPYAVIQMFLSSLGDVFGARRTLSLCLFISAASMINFGSYSNFYLFSALLFINGCAQALTWPNCIKALDAWYPDDKRNFVFGLFGTCTFAGGVIGTAVSVYLQTDYGWRHVFLLPSAIIGVLSFFVLIGLKSPKEVQLDVPGKLASVENAASSAKLKISEVLKIPCVLECSLTAMCLKIVRYCMYMWLPLYLLDELKYSKAQAGIFSIAFEVGGVCGSALVGVFINRIFMGKALRATIFLCLMSTAAMFLFQVTSHWGMFFNMFFLVLAGAANCSPDVVLSGSIPAELSDMKGIDGAASISGFINGFSTCGTFLEGPFIGFVSQNFGWGGVMYSTVAISACGTLVCYRGSVKFQEMSQKQMDQGDYT